MADAWAHPLVVQALTSTREGLAEPAKAGSYPHARMPPFNQAAHVHRWDPWVRNTLLQQDLLCHPLLDVSVAAGDKATLTIDGAPHVALSRPSEALFQAQIAAVLSHAALRSERSAEILTQIDGQGPFWAALLPARLALLPFLQEVLTAVLQVTVVIEMRFKHLFACPRPLDWSPQVQPMITTPGHGTYPMGHATQVFAAAHVLKVLLRDAVAPSALSADWLLQVDRLAWRVAENRVVAGVHFPVDLWGGVKLGVALGRHAAARLRGQATPALPEDFRVAVDERLAEVSGLIGPPLLDVMRPVNTGLDVAAPRQSGPAAFGGDLAAECWSRALDELRRVLP